MPSSPIKWKYTKEGIDFFKNDIAEKWPAVLRIYSRGVVELVISIILRPSGLEIKNSVVTLCSGDEIEFDDIIYEKPDCIKNAEHCYFLSINYVFCPYCGDAL